MSVIVDHDGLSQLRNEYFRVRDSSVADDGCQSRSQLQTSRVSVFANEEQFAISLSRCFAVWSNFARNTTRSLVLQPLERYQSNLIVSLESER